MVRRLETRGKEPCEALHGPSRAAWHLVHLVIWGAHECNLDLDLTEIPQSRRPYKHVSIDYPRSLIDTVERSARQATDLICTKSLKCS